MIFFRPPPPKPMEFEVDVQVHHYDNTPTNAEIPLLNKACDEDTDLESLYPSVPLRTSSILPRPAMVSKGETFRFVYTKPCLLLRRLLCRRLFLSSGNVGKFLSTYLQ